MNQGCFEIGVRVTGQANAGRHATKNAAGPMMFYDQPGARW